MKKLLFVTLIAAGCRHQPKPAPAKPAVPAQTKTDPASPAQTDPAPASGTTDSPAMNGPRVTGVEGRDAPAPATTVHLPSGVVVAPSSRGR